ncbi:hypothetical protein [Mumia zhuanghuii]|uniref:WxL domain-containing protein n=1 Tax=Mumia zhuanghuii TaxID=2585211 RepID=A0A5C4MKL3_9ACTN|nr:hypothetical protein [Mumia zhuanghuii]TNC45335.1 hypothetical protein FHE65_14635 [Mumia zhuanghuii]
MRSKNRVVALLAGASMLATSAVVLGATSASAAAPSGGCWVYSVAEGSPVEDTATTGNLSTSLAAWGNNADYNLTTSGGNTVGSSRNFTLTFNTGPTNGGPAASGTVYYYFSVNGTNLPAIEKPFSAPGFGPIPGDTVTGSYAITGSGTNTVKLRKVIYDIPTYTLRVQCNGQTGGVANGVNPATTPVDTNITASFSAVGPAASISGITNQVVTTAARKNDVISFGVTNFSAAGTGTVELCNVSGTSCDATSSSVSIAGDGTGSGTIAVGATPTTGSRTLKVTSGGETSLTPITILGDVTVSTNVVGGGSGTVVTVTGSNWDPNQPVTVGGYKNGPPFPPPASSDATISTTADSAGNISASFTVNDAATAFIGASRTHAAGPPPVVLFGSKAFTFSGDTCTAKQGSAATGSCALLETVELTVVAGDLKMSKDAGKVLMSGVTLDGSDQTSTGDLQDVTVKDYRGGTLGWSLVGRFSGLNGPAKPTGGNFTIAPSALTWTPTCAAQANSDDTVVAGAAGSFADASTDLPLCAVATSGAGADGTSGGDAVADAGLSLEVGSSQAAGNYSGLLTLTLS